MLSAMVPSCILIGELRAMQEIIKKEAKDKIQQMLDTILQQKEEDRKSNLKTTGEMYKDKENKIRGVAKVLIA